VLDVHGRTGDQPIVGYREATAVAEGPHLAAGTVVVGHKQHRGQVVPRAGQHPAWSWPGGQPEGFVRDGVHASYLCLHWAAQPDMASRFVTAAGGEETTLRLVS